MAQMGIDSLKANLSNPARTYLWDVIIPTPIGIGSADNLMLRCQSSQLPGRSTEKIDVNYKQTGGVRFHGRLRFPGDGTWALTFIEGEDRAMFDAFYSWCQKQVDARIGTGEEDPNTKTDVLLSLITTKGDEWLRLKLLGAWVQDIANVDLSYADSRVIEFTVTMAYDYWEQVS
jgi:hypothetical protein